MKIYKFGGASVRSAEGIRNIVNIVSAEPDDLFIVISAMGKVTNALESVLEHFMKADRASALKKLEEVETYHYGIIDELFGDKAQRSVAAPLFEEIRDYLSTGVGDDYDRCYDRLVSYGEIISTTIISAYLKQQGIENVWLDMRKLIQTDSNFREATVRMEESQKHLRQAADFSKSRIYIGQGFIGANHQGDPTTLGREGSDYTAAVAGNLLDAESVTIWKDVPGILNADPRIFADTVLIPELTYLDAVELAYSGAQIIHPKTIKPLQNKNIPLYVRPFGDKRKPGTVIRGLSAPVDVPILILKKDQVLLTIRSRDFSFVLEEKFATIFSLLERYRIKANLIHNSAVNLSLCVDNSWHIDEAVEALREAGFDVMKAEEMELLTVRGYTEELWHRYARGPQVFIRQATQSTVRVVRKRG